jgi:hypothetical protein
MLEHILPSTQIAAEVSSQEDSMPRMIAKIIELNCYSLYKKQIYQKSTKNNPLDTGNIFIAAHCSFFLAAI